MRQLLQAQLALLRPERGRPFATGQAQSDTERDQQQDRYAQCLVQVHQGFFDVFEVEELEAFDDAEGDDDGEPEPTPDRTEVPA